MAASRARKLADGSVSYTAQIRIKRAGVQVYQESQTFARKQAAQAWARKRESELDEPGAIERSQRKGECKPTTVGSISTDMAKFLEFYQHVTDLDREVLLHMVSAFAKAASIDGKKENS
jgi:hypothetical protein